MSITITHAHPNMSLAFVELTSVMGYTNTKEEMQNKLHLLCSNPQHCLLVAKEHGRVIGFCHGNVRVLTEIPIDAELNGLAVIEEFQRKGVGTLLLQVFEDWVKSKGLSTIFLSSNIMRTEAHIFYEKKGYKKTKQQFVFRKKL